jgi:hypothetical protein
MKTIEQFEEDIADGGYGSHEIVTAYAEALEEHDRLTGVCVGLRLEAITLRQNNADYAKAIHGLLALDERRTDENEKLRADGLALQCLLEEKCTQIKELEKKLSGDDA